ncbi:MAG: BatA and WFA domain-containing protein [Candidatus Binatia bacterium]
MGLAEPLALVFAGLYGVLVFFYLWERWRRRVTVPSLLLWASVPEDTIRARRLRPDLLFILQLLLLTSLIAGLARPYLRTHRVAAVSGRRIFLLDTSASMQTREQGGSRFDAARRRALERLRSVPPGDEVMVIKAGSTPEVAVSFTRDHAAVAKVLRDAVPADTGSNLGLALALAKSAGQRGDVSTALEVFTDVPRGQLPPDVRDGVTVFQVGETDDNLGIEGLQIFQGRFQDYRGARAYVLVENFAHQERHGFLTVRLEGKVVNRNGFTIPARGSEGFVVRHFPGPGRVVAHLEGADALAADDTAYGWIRPVSPVRVLVVSPPSALMSDLRDLGAATPGLRLRIVRPQAFHVQQARDADVVIFHRFVPAVEPASNALYVYPPAENRLFPVSAEATNIEVVDWDAHHAVLHALQPLAALPLHRARIITPPAWSDVLLWSRTTDCQFPLAVAGEHRGRRVACITFDLAAEGLLGSDSINLFLFFMNLLGWLTPESLDVAVVDTGDVYAIDQLPPQPVRVRDPRGTTYVLPADRRTVAPRFAGEYRLRSDGTGRTLLANFFDPVESDIGRASRERPVVAASAHGASAARKARRWDVPRDGLARWLYAAAAVLFMLEWAVARWQGAGGVVR